MLRNELFQYVLSAPRKKEKEIWNLITEPDVVLLLISCMHDILL